MQCCPGWRSRGDEKSWKGDESIWRLRKKRERPWPEEKATRAQIARNLEKRRRICIWGAESEEVTHSYTSYHRKDHSHDKLSSGGQHRSLLILPFLLISTLVDCELWWLSCRCIYIFTVSASSAGILLRTRRTALPVRFVADPVALEGDTHISYCQDSYFLLLCLWLPPQHYYIPSPIFSLCTDKISWNCGSVPCSLRSTTLTKTMQWSGLFSIWS